MKYIITEGTTVWRSRTALRSGQPDWEKVEATRGAILDDDDIVPEDEKFTVRGYYEFYLPKGLDGNWIRLAVDVDDVKLQGE